jgi:SAM-dependent methyltransferase
MLPKERVVHDHRQPPWIRHEHLERYRFASRLVSGRTVVDCACGDGTGTELLARAGAGRVHGFDVSPEAVATARATTDGTQAEIELADAHALPLPDRSVDVYVSLETIEHVEHPDRFLDEVVRVLRDDGTLVCSTPNRDVYSPGTRSTRSPGTPSTSASSTATSSPPSSRADSRSSRSTGRTIGTDFGPASSGSQDAFFHGMRPYDSGSWRSSR